MRLEVVKIRNLLQTWIKKIFRTPSQQQMTLSKTIQQPYFSNLITKYYNFSMIKLENQHL